MREAGYPDVFIVINGPQDGTEFPIMENTVKIGQGNSCAINIALDRNVLPFHGIATAVGNGYRIRSTSGGTFLVDGKRAGRLKSRVLQSGGIMRVGYTELQLDCSLDGISRRSKGIKIPSDFVWAVKEIGKGLRVVLGTLLGFIIKVPGFALRHKILSLVALLLVIRFVPGLYRIVYPLIKGVQTSFLNLFSG
ncbi:MAG: FHA domain-containing protein [Candidatus Hydrogenedentota bacterium]